MENDFLTSGDLALMESYRGRGNSYCCDYGRTYGRSAGMATTGIGLAAGLGGGALLLAAAGLWGVNQASKARATGNSNALNTLANLAISERNSREAWQLHHMPTIGQFVDVRTGSQAVANSASNAFANAESQIVADALTGRSQICPQAVSLYSAPQPCPCPTSCGCNC